MLGSKFDKRVPSSGARFKLMRCEIACKNRIPASLLLRCEICSARSTAAAAFSPPGHPYLLATSVVPGAEHAGLKDRDGPLLLCTALPTLACGALVSLMPSRPVLHHVQCHRDSLASHSGRQAHCSSSSSSRVRRAGATQEVVTTSEVCDR
eukprot:544849-Rhodomonas_salina.2